MIKSQIELNRNKPFLKWAGNKYRVLPHLLPLVGKPKTFCEPFGGSFSVALNIFASRYVLADINRDLISVYQTLLKDPESFVDACKALFTCENNSREAYNKFRNEFNTTDSLERKSHLFIYLNRHCFNGLTRYNSKGSFNVPFGKYARPYFPEKELRGFASSFCGKEYTLLSTGFEDMALYGNLGEGSVVFFDPPYVPASETANFTDYATGGFSFKQQEQLAQLAKLLQAEGIKSIITNSDCDITKALYEGAKIIPIEVSRTISAKGSSRKKAKEIIAVFEP
jgi:DNA adenine methylase